MREAPRAKSNTIMKIYEHLDSLGNQIQPGQPIAFTHSYLKGVKVGTVIKSTRQRVKINYKYTYENKDGVLLRGHYDTLIQPARTIVLDNPGPSITMYLLKMS